MGVLHVGSPRGWQCSHGHVGIGRLRSHAAHTVLEAFRRLGAMAVAGGCTGDGVSKTVCAGQGDVLDKA